MIARHVQPTRDDVADGLALATVPFAGEYTTERTDSPTSVH
jgi:hypothetical protein